MKDMTVKYRHGTCGIGKHHPLSASMLDQALEQAQSDLCSALGIYEWRLEGDTYRGYKVVAKYNDNRTMKTERFIESTGKTPRLAMRGWAAGCEVFRTVYGIEF